MAETWIDGPERPRLTRPETHLWLVSLKPDGPAREALADTLEEGERRRARRFRFAQDRCRYVVARGALRAILASYLDTAPAAIEFLAGARGKPRLAAGGLRFNTSHSGEWAMVTIALDRELGVDLERRDPARADSGMAKRFFAPGEVRALEELSGSAWVEGFFNCWTRKEAYVKATGAGLYIPLDAFEVSLAPAEPAALLSIGGSATEAARWSLAAVAAPPGYSAALVSEGSVGALRRFRWQS